MPFGTANGTNGIASLLCCASVSLWERRSVRCRTQALALLRLGALRSDSQIAALRRRFTMALGRVSQY